MYLWGDPLTTAHLYCVKSLYVTVQGLLFCCYVSFSHTHTHSLTAASSYEQCKACLSLITISTSAEKKFPPGSKSALILLAD